MPDFSHRKINLTTPQPNGRKGESPLAAFTKVNDLINDLTAGKVLKITPWPLTNLNSSPANVAPGEYDITSQTNRPDDATGSVSWNGYSFFFKASDGLMYLRKWSGSAWSAWSAYRPSGKPAHGHFGISADYPIPDKVRTYIDFDIIHEAEGVSRDTNVEPNFFRVAKSGIYAVMGRTRFIQPALHCDVLIQPSSPAVMFPGGFPTASITPSAINHQRQAITGVFHCPWNNQGFRFGVYQNSGSAQNIPANDTFLTIIRVGEAI